MPIVYDKTRKRFRYQLHRIINRQRVRANKILPKGWSRAQADEYDRIETARIVAEKHGLQRRQASIEDAVHLYLTERATHLKSQKSVIEDLAAIHGYYASRSFEDLPGISRAYANDSVLALKPATIKKRIALLRAACRYAWKNHNMGEGDPGARLYIPPVKNERQIYLDRKTLVQIARKMPRTSRGVALIAFYSGMRLGEILRATIKDGAFVLADTKNDSPRHVPVHPKVLIYSRKPAKLTLRTIQAHFMSASRAKGLNVHFHDLRHSAASEMINNEIDLYTVGAVLGHKSAQSTKRYAHLAQSKLREAVNRIGRNLSPTRPKKAA